MHKYYINKNPQTNKDHEVHHDGCQYLPQPYNCTFLGEFDNCEPAMKAAIHYYEQVNGCFYCCKECHTKKSHSS